ncbi:MAG TPA: flagellar protein FliS [Terriglobales bacterium]
MNRDARSVYRQGVGQNANPLRLIVLLYEQLIEDLRRAVQAIEAGDIEGRTNHLSHAMEVLGELNASLNLEDGQEVAENLAHYYGLLRSGLFHVQVHPDRRILEKHIANLLSLREAGIEVEHRHGSASPVTQTELAANHESGGRPSESDWRA